MSDNSKDIQPPKLADLKSAAEPTGKQKFANFFGLGYGGNTAVSVATVKLARKLMPDVLEKWENHYADKYMARKVKKTIDPIADKIDDESRQAIEKQLEKEAKEYGKKTVDSRLLSTGGFAMLPFQSAKQIHDYGTNIAPHVEGFRQECTQLGMDATQTESALQSAIDQQRSQLQIGDKKGANILNGALEKPEFSPLGPAAKDDLPKWIVGRCIALGAAFTSQSIVDDRFQSPKDAVDNMLAKVVTRIAHPTGYNQKPAENAAFAEEQANNTATPGVDPKIHDIVRMVTTDAYMTSVAIATHMGSMSLWDKKAPAVTQGYKNLAAKLGKPSGPEV
ncbi:MAG: hypothetical protein MK052_09900 [Alphaproteobacteria bacterium]|nr:hypothetical protein [Alphaproteobacteria bacterium]